MIPQKITGNIFSLASWKPKTLEHIDEELEGYMILGADPIYSYKMPNGKTAIDGVNLFLQKPGEEEIKMVNLDADILTVLGLEDKAGNEDPFIMRVATLK